MRSHFGSGMEIELGRIGMRILFGRPYVEKHGCPLGKVTIGPGGMGR